MKYSGGLTYSAMILNPPFVNTPFDVPTFHRRVQRTTMYYHSFSTVYELHNSSEIRSLRWDSSIHRASYSNDCS